MFDEEIERERKQAARGLVPRAKERDHLVADVLVAQALAGHRVARFEHPAEQVLLHDAGHAGLPLCDQVVGDLVHEADVFGKPAPRGQHELGLERMAGRSADRLGQRPRQGAHERMRLALVKAVETIAHGAQRDGVEREAGHIVRYVDDRVLTEPLPAHQQLIGDVVHAIEHVAHRGGAEDGHQDAVGLPPVRLVVVCAEQAIAGELADVLDRLVLRLLEALLVRQLVDELLRADEDHVAAGQAQAVDGPAGTGRDDACSGPAPWGRGP